MTVQFQSLLDKALAIDAADFAFLHMRGRFAFSVAELSWIERKVKSVVIWSIFYAFFLQIASTIFATLPSATFEEALRDFLAVIIISFSLPIHLFIMQAEELKPGLIQNLFYIGKCYIGQKHCAL